MKNVLKKVCLIANLGVFKDFFLIVAFLFATTVLFAQKTILKKVEIYGISWKVRSRIPITVKDFKGRNYYFHYHLVLEDNTLYCLEKLFYDYKDCKELLMLQDTIPLDNYYPAYRNKPCIARVKLFFRIGRTITIFFRAGGEYYFQGKYYKANKELYYCIFSFFAKDAVMPNELIEEGKIIYEQNRKKELEEENKKRQEFLEKQKQGGRVPDTIPSLIGICNAGFCV